MLGTSRRSAVLTVAGAQHVQPMGGATSYHAAVLRNLLARGTPPNVEDTVGLTALHQPTMNLLPARPLAPPPTRTTAHRNPYGNLPLHATLMTTQADTADLLLQLGADYDLPDADGTIARARSHATAAPG
ncbi:hypothetical protein PLICRDRAFT_175026 [Plicaturopsis crispa FD-325 SS-3]|nr:hypothetical protein PLICRDRAFT_175026 [Plicaturopsis crispa FD-325 SS-3]